MITVKGASTKYLLKCLNANVNMTFQLFISSSHCGLYRLLKHEREKKNVSAG